MWVDDQLLDDGCRSIYMMCVHEIHVLELRIEMSVSDRLSS